MSSLRNVYCTFSIMSTTRVRTEILYAWKGSSLLVVTPRGECGNNDTLSGFYYREARFLRTFRLLLNGHVPWLCEAAALDPARVSFSYVYPELTRFGGGGSGQSGDEESTDEDGVPHRLLPVHLVYSVRSSGLDVDLWIANHARRDVSCDAAIEVNADFIDIQEAFPGGMKPRAPVDARVDGTCLTLRHRHDQLPYEAVFSIDADRTWEWNTAGLYARLRLASQETTHLQLRLRPSEPERSAADDEAREHYLQRWRAHFTRVSVPRNRLVEDIVAANVRDVASFPLLEGPRDEWLALQAGMPLYPALFGRDTLTAGWQAACLDCGESLDASLTALGRMQSHRVNEWRDEEPGRLPYQVRRGPQAILDINPYAAYYADFASPLMYVIALGHLYAWTGEKPALQRHWDTARRILDWARRDGDKDHDGYLEYLTRSSKGTTNQG